MSLFSLKYLKAAPPAPSGAKIIKTGQTVSQKSGDDGDLEKGRTSTFHTLGSNNPFGNTNRFTYIDGTQNYTNKIVIDWTTYDGTTVLGYGYFIGGTNRGSNWDNAVSSGLTHSVGTYTSGWRLANIRELQNLQDWGIDFFQRDYAPFNTLGSSNVAYNDLWSSTSLPEAPSTSKLYLEAEIGYTQDALKTNTKSAIPVRTFTVTGTTLT